MKIRSAVFAILTLSLLIVGCSIPSTPEPQVVVVTSPPIEITREVLVTREIPVTQIVEVTPLPSPTSIFSPTPAIVFDSISWIRDPDVPRICIGQGVAFRMEIIGKPGMEVAYHINHYDGNGAKIYRSKDFLSQIESDGKLVKSFGESFPYQSKWQVQLVITWPLPLITRNASITVDCN